MSNKESFKPAFDLTQIMCQIFDKIVDEFVLARNEKGEFSNDPVQILWESKKFLRHSIRKIYQVMYARHPYDANSKTALSTDVSNSSIRRFAQKK